MLIWVKFFLIIFLIFFITIAMVIRSFFELCILIEVLVIILFLLFFLNATLFNLYYFFGIGFVYLILGGLELSLNLLILLIN